VSLEPAYLPQYVAETMGVVIGTVAILSGIVLLVKGAVPSSNTFGRGRCASLA
jgi:hypothetical protein